MGCPKPLAKQMFDGEIRFTLRWTLGTLFAWIAGSVVCSSSLAVALPLAALPSVIPVLIAFVFSAVTVATIQWSINLVNKLELKKWIFASVLSTICSLVAVRFTVPRMFTTTTSEMSGFYQTFELQKYWLVEVIVFSITLGISLSVPRWLMLKRSGYQATSLVWVNVLGLFLSQFLLAVLISLL